MRCIRHVDTTTTRVAQELNMISICDIRQRIFRSSLSCLFCTFSSEFSKLFAIIRSFIFSYSLVLPIALYHFLFSFLLHFCSTIAPVFVGTMQDCLNSPYRYEQSLLVQSFARQMLDYSQTKKMRYTRKTNFMFNITTLEIKLLQKGLEERIVL